MVATCQSAFFVKLHYFSLVDSEGSDSMFFFAVVVVKSRVMVSKSSFVCCFLN